MCVSLYFMLLCCLFCLFVFVFLFNWTFVTHVCLSCWSKTCCAPPVLFCQHWKKWWWWKWIDVKCKKNCLNVFKINIKTMPNRKFRVKTLHIVYLLSLFSLITSAMPHAYTGSFTTSFLMSGHTAWKREHEHSYQN